MLTRQEAVERLTELWREGGLPPSALDDWRIHPATLAALVAMMHAEAPRRVLDVGAGSFQTLARELRARWPRATVVAMDLKPPEAGAVAVRADARSLPWASESFDAIASRLFLGAPVSQLARREWVKMRERAHQALAAAAEGRILGELRRVSVPGALQVHHVLERKLFSNPEDAGLSVCWPIAPEVPTPPSPWKDHARAALEYHLSGVLVLRARVS